VLSPAPAPASDVAVGVSPGAVVPASFLAQILAPGKGRRGWGSGGGALHMCCRCPRDLPRPRRCHTPRHGTPAAFEKGKDRHAAAKTTSTSVGNPRSVPESEQRWRPGLLQMLDEDVVRLSLARHAQVGDSEYWSPILRLRLVSVFGWLAEWDQYERLTYLHACLGIQDGACDVRNAGESPWNADGMAAPADAFLRATCPWSLTMTSEPLNHAHASHQR
jgi:hypothetical protein